jgi:hypothetical protein
LQTNILAKQVKQWLSESVIEPVARQPLENNMVFVAKKNGDTRACLDATPINNASETYQWPLPRLQDLRHQLKGFTWFVRIDLKSAFFRIRVPREWRKYLVFVSENQAYQFKKMPFGVTDGPAVFQEWMDRTLARFRGQAVWYIDDILVCAHSEQAVNARARRVRSAIAEAGMTENAAKGEGPAQQLLFAGMWITGTGIGPNQDKIKELAALPAPRTKKEQQSALGLVSYLRDHVPLASHFSASLYPGKGQVLTTEDYESEWEKLRRHVIRAATHLTHFDETKDASLYADASGTSLGCLLIQDGRIISLASRKLRGAETRYSATDREHLALVFAAERFPLFLHRKQGKTLVGSDHAALLTRKTLEMTPRQFRWKMKTDYWMPHVTHVPGISNPADFVSRWSVELFGGAVKTI